MEILKTTIWTENWTQISKSQNRKRRMKRGMEGYFNPYCIRYTPSEIFFKI